GPEGEGRVDPRRPASWHPGPGVRDTPRTDGHGITDSRRKRVLIVNCYLAETRAGIGRSHKIRRAMGPAYLAGAFSRTLCEVRLHSELFSGPLEDERLLGWPDMLVLTGLTTALDRMRHLTAYARTKNRRVIVVAGGHA